MTATGTVHFAAAHPLRPDQAERPPGSAGAPFTTVATAVVRGRGLGLSTEAKLLYVVLRSYAAPDGTCYPGYATLRADVGCGANQLTRAARELEAAGLITRRRRGQGRPTLYTVHGPAGVPPLLAQTPPRSESRIAAPVILETPLRGAEQDSGDQDPAEQQHGSPAPEDVGDPAGAGGDDVALVAALQGRGLTPRMAQQLVTHYGAGAIREQLAWHPHRPPAKNPAGALVQAIRERWPAPPAWLEAREHAAAVTRRAEEECREREEEEARRREWVQKPPEERIAGRLQFWLLGRRAKRREPTAAEVAAKRAELLAELRRAAPPAPAG